MWTDEDIEYMRRALVLAERGAGHVSPNPMVGAVIVKNGKVIAEGWHKAFGALHAETDALASCTEDPAGAVMYVTLEPCCHYGKQPPCTSAIIEAGIAKVVAGMTDPNPLVSGKGLSVLREHGIEVCSGLLETESRYLNRIFIKYMTEHKPWVVLKSAMTLDGRIAAASGDSMWVSCEDSRHYAHMLRGRYMGILAGIGTVIADDPMLNCRIDGAKQPVRIIADSHARLPLGSAIVKSAGEFPVLLAHTAEAEQCRIDMLRKCGIDTVECASDADGKIDMTDLMCRLGERGLDSVMVEGGAEINWSLIKNGLADEFYFFIAPKIIGGSSAKGPVGGVGFPKMEDASAIAVESVSRSGCDWLVHGFSEKNRGILEGLALNRK